MATSKADAVASASTSSAAPATAAPSASATPAGVVAAVTTAAAPAAAAKPPGGLDTSAVDADASSSVSSSSSSSSSSATLIRVVVQVMHRANTSVPIYVQPSDTVLTLKNAIHKCGFEAPANQCLFACGTALDGDAKPLSSFGITRDAAAATGEVAVQLVVLMSNALAQALALEEKRAVDLAIEAGKGGVSGCTALLAVGANPLFHQKKYGVTALMTAAWNGHDAVVALLLSHAMATGGAEAHAALLNAADFFGKTALMYAAQYARVAVLKTLLAAGADVHRTTKDGRTALMYAARDAGFEATVLLIQANARITATATLAPPPADDTAPEAAVSTDSAAAAPAAVTATTVTAISLAKDDDTRRVLEEMRKKKVRCGVAPEWV